MKNFFLDRVVIVDLSRGSADFLPLPVPAKQNGDLACLAAEYDDALVLTVGRFTGSYAPASCLLTVRSGDRNCYLKGQCGAALRRCGIDALVLRGMAVRSSGLILSELGVQFLDVDATADTFMQRTAMRREVFQCGNGDNDPVTFVTGPAAFADCAAPALVSDYGIAPRSTLAARWLAAHNLVGLCLNGSVPYISPLPLDNAARTVVQPTLLTSAGLDAVLQVVRPGVRSSELAVGRSIACHACPTPCQFWSPTPEGHVAVTSPEALSLLVERGASATQIAALLLLAERCGIEPLGLVEYATATLPTDATAIGLVQSVQDVEPDAADALGTILGVCPLFLRRFPVAQEALERLAAGAVDGVQ
ncbi:MAG: hypothetical protein IJU65_10070 [Desulfovibrio sp.]|nr:hypothetical protein [Desulfovibrio sp.]